MVSLKMLMVSLAFMGVSTIPDLMHAETGIGVTEESALVAEASGARAEIAASEEVPPEEASSGAEESGTELLRDAGGEMAAKLAEREAELAKREAALAAREADLVKQNKASSASSVELASREAELAGREASLAAREADLVKQGNDSVASATELSAREAELARREVALAARETALEEQGKASSASSEKLAARAADLAAREEALKKEETLLAERRKADLEAREAELKKKEAALTEKESALQVKEIALMEKAPVVADARGVAVPDVDGPGAVVVKKENGLMNWTENYIEATGMAVAPTGTKGAQGKALARRGATLDLQRNLLEFLKGVQIDSRTTMNDFMAEDRVRSEISGLIKNVEVVNGEWDGEAYTVTGRIKLPPVRAVVAPKIPVDRSYQEPQPKKSAGRFTGLVIDARHLPLVPSMSFRVLDESGKPVYGMEFVDYDRFLQSGLCAYYNNINYAKGEIHVAGNPIVTKAVKLKNGNVDIVIPNSAAAKVRGSSYDFRKDCKVIVVSK